MASAATQPTISHHHPRILVEAGIFTRDKRGLWACQFAGVRAGQAVLAARPPGRSLPR